MRSITDQMLQHEAGLAEMVRAENHRQIDKWGVQTHSPADWMLFLTEELGELAEAIAECGYRDGRDEHVVMEATQVATLALKIAEMYCWSPAQAEERTVKSPNNRMQK